MAIKKKVFEQSWHGSALPGGEFAISHLGPDTHIQTHLGRLDGPNGTKIDLLWTRCFASPNGFRVAGATHEGDVVLERVGNEWVSKGAAFGMNPVCYDRNGVLHIARLEHGAQGIAFFTDSNVLVTGDQTSFDTRTGLHNWVSKSGFVIGQATGGSDNAVVFCPDGSKRLLEGGTCKFIQLEVDGPRFAVTIVKELNGQADKTVVYFGDLADLNALPLFNEVVPSPSPIPDPTPTPMPNPPASQIEKVAARRSQFPNWPVGHADFMILIARDLNGKLHRKESSPSAVRLPSGRKVSPDGVVIDGWFVDILGDAEGTGTPAWDPKGPALPDWELLDPFQEALGGATGDPGPSPAPTPLPDPDDRLEAILERLNAIEDDLLALTEWGDEVNAQIGTLGAQVRSLTAELARPRTFSTEVSSAGWGPVRHSHTVTVKENK